LRKINSGKLRVADRNAAKKGDMPAFCNKFVTTSGAGPVTG
jgi:hypothetical protein